MDASERKNCTADNIFEKSLACYNYTFDCYPYNESISIAVGIWCIFNSVLGSIGNLLTIFSLAYAAKCKMYVIYF